MKIKKLMALVMSLVMLFALCACTVEITIDFPETAESGPVSGNVAGWYYTAEAGKAVIVSTGDAVKESQVIAFPAEVDGYSVAEIGANGTAVITNASGFVLFPEGVTAIGDGAFYDLNRTPGWSFPSTLAEMGESALDSCGGTFYAALSAQAAAVGEATGHEVDTGAMGVLTVSAGKGGAIYPNGTYNLPAAAEGLTMQLTVLAAEGYVIDTLDVNGAAVDEAAGLAEYSFEYAAAEGAVSVTFAEGEAAQPAALDMNEAAAAAAAVDAPSDSIVDGAVAEGAELPADVFDEVADIDGEGTNKYISTMGVMTGTTYAVDGMLYEMVYVTQNVRYATKAQIINTVYETEGLVYGRDYDLIRLYNYVHSYSNGPRPGDFHIYTCYLYKSIGSEADGVSTNYEWERAYEHVVDGVDQVIQGDVASLMVQAGESVTVNNIFSCNNTIAYGPSEAANFYGLGSAILVDGGNSTDYKLSDFSAIDFGDDDSCLILNNPTVVGTENVLYAVAGGTAYVTGGRYFGCSSGGHGFYVGMGGKICLNGESFIAEDGTVITDTEELASLVQARPGIDLGTAQAAELTEDWNAYAEPVFTEGVDEDIAILVTADETGTALTTDTGGGVIVANRISATTYGRGCAGVYSIGSNESYVYVYNSSLHSNMDSGVVSASAGYVFCYNCDLVGVAGIKTRSGGSGACSGVHAYNSRIVCDFNPDAYDFYHMGSNEDTWEEDAGEFADWTWADDSGYVNCPMLNMFVNKTNCAFGDDLETVQSYWFEDKTTAPQTGEVMACVILTGTASVECDSCYFENLNYEKYADEGATNYLVAGDNGGNGTIDFYNQNSATKWDLTGESDATCELKGDIYIAEVVTMSGPDAGSGPSTVNANFHNSEWSGDVIGFYANANFTFDADSLWIIESDEDETYVGNLTLETLDSVISATPITLHVSESLTVGGEAVTEGFTWGNVTYVIGA